MDRQSRMRKLFNSLTVLESVPTFLAHKVDVLAIANIFFLKSTHISSNYHLIVNVPPKLPIVSIVPLKLPKNVNVPLIPTKRQK
jgi:hypothetical protein